MKMFKLIAVLMFGLSGSNVFATTFTPEVNPDGTFEEVDFFYFGLPAGYTLGLFDSADAGFSTPLYVPTGAAVAVSPASPYSASVVGLPLTTILLGSTPEFMLGLFDGSSWIADSGVYANNTAGTAFSVFFSPVPGSVFSVDLVLASVPLPAAFWVFGSGLIGLVLISRRNAQ